MLILRTLLFGPAHGHETAKHIQRSTDDMLPVVEGFFDATEVHVSGFQNVCAPMESFLSETQAQKAGKRCTQLEIWQADIETSFARRLLPVTKAIGDQWAILSAQAQRRGTPLAVMDGFIAATALEHALTVATRNVKGLHRFGRCGLQPVGYVGPHSSSRLGCCRGCQAQYA